MKFLLPLAAAASIASGVVNAQPDSFERAVPALSYYGSTVVEADLWGREGLSPRDRSIVTVATLVAREQTALMPAEFARALENGVTPSELSGLITHLAFYAGWGNAAAASDALASRL